MWRRGRGEVDIFCRCRNGRDVISCGSRGSDIGKRIKTRLDNVKVPAQIREEKADSTEFDSEEQGGRAGHFVVKSFFLIQGFFFSAGLSTISHVVPRWYLLILSTTRPDSSMILFTSLFHQQP